MLLLGLILADIFLVLVVFFFFNDTATTEIYTLSLHDALPISPNRGPSPRCLRSQILRHAETRSEEHTSELQSHHDLVCRLLLEKKKNNHMHSPPKKKKKKKPTNNNKTTTK